LTDGSCSPARDNAVGESDQAREPSFRVEYQEIVIPRYGVLIPVGPLKIQESKRLDSLGRISATPRSVRSE
jgi:hypothetical protein